MGDKRSFVCYLCDEPECIDKECVAITGPDQLSVWIKNGLKIVQNTASDLNSLISLKYSPAHARERKYYKPYNIQHHKKFLPAKKFLSCYFCSEPECLEKDCLFLAISDHIKERRKKLFNVKYLPFDTGKSKGISLRTLYIHGVKLFWLIAFIVTIGYILFFGGIPLLATTYSMQSQLPIQLYIGIFGVGVTVVSLALANLFGIDSKTAK
jgi:hypothetical protein